MAAALTLIVLVAAGEANDRATLAMERAARGALAPDTRLEIREARGAPSDAEALADERRAHADVVAEILWSDPTHRRATLRLHFAGSSRWIDRSIGFAASDADAERGRTVGFALLSMLPETPPATPIPTPTPTPTPIPPGSPDHLPSALVEVTGLGAIGGDANGLGAAGGAHWFALRPLSLRVGGGVLAGSLARVQGTTTTAFASAGLSLHPWRAVPDRPFGLSVRVDYLVLRQSITHFSPDDPSPATLARWLSGVDAAVEVEWLFAKDVGALLGAGIVDVFDATFVDLRDVRVATIPPVRGFAEAGLRIRF